MKNNCPKCGSSKRYVPINPLNDNCKCIECGTNFKIDN